MRLNDIRTQSAGGYSIFHKGKACQKIMYAEIGIECFTTCFDKKHREIRNNTKK